ncbi:Uncharacterised protein [Ewingella americana]|uniref:Uncharacterized protein n=1 Tax=Ewingella americana TaxID=41202 RepID=A0A377NEL1_9GAMM|nr:Uncharacterised protein [Ewingella americana]
MSESYTPEYLALAERFRPVFARIAEGVVERENSRTLPLEPLRWLKEAGFGTVRIPVADGGLGATLPSCSCCSPSWPRRIPTCRRRCVPTSRLSKTG